MTKRYKIRLLTLATALASCLAGGYFFLAQDPDTDPAAAYASLGKRTKLQTAYASWATRHERGGGDKKVVIPLGWSKALSGEVTNAKGRIKLDLIDGTVFVEVRGLQDPEVTDVWLVDNRPGPGRSSRPEPGDGFLWAGSLKRNGDKGTLTADLGEVLANFEVDAIVVTRSGKNPREPGVLYGSPELFQRLYTRARTGRFSPLPGNPFVRLAAVGPDPAYADVVFPTVDSLVQRGAHLFFHETFEGNGRTCATCHPAENNFTIDPEFIATLRNDDPLFVAEFVPALRDNFEKPGLMRRAGLILENTNGFGDLEQDFTMRGVPHTLALMTSLTPPSDLADGTTIPPEQRTGWSGDGAPGSGRLRDFATGAVIQHFPKTLGRVAGVDFRLPTDDELDALEAFQLFLGRQADIDLASISFKSSVVERGREIFNTTDSGDGGKEVAAGKCVVCHNNAGANAQAGGNSNFNTGVEDLPDTPGELISDALGDPRLAEIRPDDGFGVGDNDASGTFNTPPLIEAADTGPFFHNNAIQSLEAAVGFYDGDAFNESPAGEMLATLDSQGAGIELDGTQIAAIAAFLRVLNTLENIRSASETAEFVLRTRRFQTAHDLLWLALADVNDGIEVLHAGGLHPDAQASLNDAQDHLQAASRAHSQVIRNLLIAKGLQKLAEARRNMAKLASRPAAAPIQIQQNRGLKQGLTVIP